MHHVLYKQRLSRRGFTAVLAMIYLALFATLALGFYAATTANAVTSQNERNGTISLTAAESGMDFLRYQLSLIKIPPATPNDQVWSYVADHLQDNLEGTGNFAGNFIGVTSSGVSIPANVNNFIKLDSSGGQFRGSLELVGQQIRVKTNGRYANATSASNRAVQLDYMRTDLPTTIFNYAVASRGKVVMQKGAVTATAGVSNSIASIMSGKGTGPAISVSGGMIGGDLNITAAGLAAIGGGSVGGSTSAADIIANHTHVVGAPDFPLFDTTVFKNFATNVYSGGSVLKNVRILANTNPKFTGGASIQGILYIESPNIVEFRGNVQMQGFIVFENKGSSTTNVIDMRGNTSHLPLPAGAEFDALRTITGISIMAPTAKMTISGSVDSSLEGNVILGSFANGGSADWTIDKGSIVTLDAGDAAVFNGKTVQFSSTGSLNIPSMGLKYTSYFRPDALSYQEIKP
jgi:Tfp pilus assembly protein PilX